MDPTRIMEFYRTSKELEQLNRRTPFLRPQRAPNTEMSNWETSVKKSIKAQKQSKKEGQTFIVNVFSNAHCCKTPFKQLKPIHLRDMQVPKVHEGCYLVCKVVGTPCAKVGVHVLVQDLNGDVEHVEVYNYSYNMADTKWIPIGTILVVKEPYLCFGSTKQNVVMRVDSPSDLIFVDPSDIDFLENVDAEKWFQASTTDPDAIKEEGNKCFLAKDYETATFMYNRAIRYAPDMPVLYLNRASSQLRSGYFEDAYRSAKVALNKGGDREKALFRMGLAAYGMRDWESAVDHFKTTSKEFPKNADAKAELTKANDRLKESRTGKYDWKAMRFTVKNGKRELDIADYVGPIEVVDIPGKGEGIVATKDIPKGTLLIASKPFSIAYEEDFSGSLVSVNVATNNIETNATKLQMVRAIEQARKNPSKAKELYKLYAGDLPSSADIPEGVIDVDRIEKISAHNCFVIDGGDRMNWVETEVTSACGIYLLPSRFNHNCMPNAKRTFLGDIMLVHATTNLKKGSEINFTYAPPTEAYQKRIKILAFRGFTCQCRLCKVDANDKNYAERAQLLEHFEELYQYSDPATFVAIGKQMLDKMRTLYCNRSELKIDLAQMLNILGRVCCDTNEIESAITYYEELIPLVDDEFVTTLELPTSLLLLARCYDIVGKGKKAANLIKKAYDMSFCTDVEHFKLLYTDIPEKYLNLIL